MGLRSRGRKGSDTTERLSTHRVTGTRHQGLISPFWQDVKVSVTSPDLQTGCQRLREGSHWRWSAAGGEWLVPPLPASFEAAWSEVRMNEGGENGGGVRGR